jgi:hypothetical protein
MKEYCTVDSVDCSLCSLSSYGRDCQSNPIRGGKREGAGRPSTGRKKQNIYVTDEELIEIKKLIEKMRKED